jgi:hypothetical protein
MAPKTVEIAMEVCVIGRFKGVPRLILSIQRVQVFDQRVAVTRAFWDIKAMKSHLIVIVLSLANKY